MPISFKMSFKEPEKQFIGLLKCRLLEPNGNGAYSHALFRTD